MLCWAFFYLIAHKVSSPSWGDNRVGCYNSKPCWLLRPKMNDSHCTHSTLILPCQSKFYSSFQLGYLIVECIGRELMSNSKFITQLINSCILELTSIVTFNSLDGCFKLIINALDKLFECCKHIILINKKEHLCVSSEIIHNHKSVFVSTNASVCGWFK